MTAAAYKGGPQRNIRPRTDTNGREPNRRTSSHKTNRTHTSSHKADTRTTPRAKRRHAPSSSRPRRAAGRRPRRRHRRRQSLASRHASYQHAGAGTQLTSDTRTRRATADSKGGMSDSRTPQTPNKPPFKGRDERHTPSQPAFGRRLTSLLDMHRAEPLVFSSRHPRLPTHNRPAAAQTAPTTTPAPTLKSRPSTGSPSATQHWQAGIGPVSRQRGRVTQ